MLGGRGSTAGRRGAGGGRGGAVGSYKCVVNERINRWLGIGEILTTTAVAAAALVVLVERLRMGVNGHLVA